MVDTVLLVLVAAAALVAAVATYGYIGENLLVARESVYALLFAAPIGVLALVDLARGDGRRGVVARAGLGVAGIVVTVIEIGEVRAETAFFAAYVVYALACAHALIAWRATATTSS
jgi:hypothetical protein